MEHRGKICIIYDLDENRKGTDRMRDVAASVREREREREDSTIHAQQQYICIRTSSKQTKQTAKKYIAAQRSAATKRWILLLLL